MDPRHNVPVTPAMWLRCDNSILPLWWDRFCAVNGAQSAAIYAGGLFTADRRRPIAQWYNAALDAALLVAPESSPEWPVQRFGVFYAPPGAGFAEVYTDDHIWHPATPLLPPTEKEAFAAAVASAEAFLQAEMNFS